MPTTLLRGASAALLLCLLQAACMAAPWRCTTASGQTFDAAGDLGSTFSGMRCKPLESSPDPNANALPEPILIPLSPRKRNRTDAAPSTTAQQRCLHLEALVAKIAAQQEQDPLLLHAIVQQTSAYQSDYLASDGAMGLMRVLPDLAHQYGVIDARTLSQSKANLTVAARHLAVLHIALQGELLQILRNYYAGLSADNLLPKDAEASPAARQFVHGVMLRYLELHRLKTFGTGTPSRSACLFMDRISIPLPIAAPAPPR